MQYKMFANIIIFKKKCGIDRVSFTDITEETIKQIQKEVDEDKSFF